MTTTTEMIEDCTMDRFLVEPQLRQGLDPKRIELMAQSIAAVGQLQPIRARPNGDKLTPVDGHYRLAAMMKAGRKTIATIIEQKELTKADILERSLVANCQREDFNPIEVATGIEELLAATSYTAGQVAERLGFSDAKVSSLRKLLKLPPAIIAEVRSGKIAASAACELARVPDPRRQAELAESVASGGMTRDGLTGARKSAKRKAAAAARSLSRATAVLGPQRSVSVSAADLTLERFIELIEELLSKARRVRSKGLELNTFLKMLADQSRRGQAQT